MSCLAVVPVSIPAKNTLSNRASRGARLGFAISLSLCGIFGAQSRATEFSEIPNGIRLYGTTFEDYVRDAPNSDAENSPASREVNRRPGILVPPSDTPVDLSAREKVRQLEDLTPEEMESIPQTEI